VNTLDSRFVRLGDCFAHRFSVPGTFRYTLSVLPSSFAAHHHEGSGLTVTVTPASGAPQATHYLIVSTADGVTALPERATVTAGDLVVWSPDKSVPLGFRVRGTIDEQVVDSGAMRTESIFTHAFGLAGTYCWRDANGSTLKGKIHVAAPGDDCDTWLERLKDGALVHVRGDRAEPESVEITVGQTVVWAVEDAPGVTITDVSLLLHAGGRDQDAGGS
jgi:plastocyanin